MYSYFLGCVFVRFLLRSVAESGGWAVTRGNGERWCGDSEDEAQGQVVMTLSGDVNGLLICGLLVEMPRMDQVKLKE